MRRLSVAGERTVSKWKIRNASETTRKVTGHLKSIEKLNGNQEKSRRIRCYHHSLVREGNQTCPKGKSAGPGEERLAILPRGKASSCHSLKSSWGFSEIVMATVIALA